jgi:hypothetical protein
MSYDEHQAMWPQMIAALAAIDAELGIPDDGCNSTGQTLAAIRALKAKAEISQALAKTATAGNWHTPVVHDHNEEPEPRYTAQEVWWASERPPTPVGWSDTDWLRHLETCPPIGYAVRDSLYGTSKAGVLRFCSRDEAGAFAVYASPRPMQTEPSPSTPPQVQGPLTDSDRIDFLQWLTTRTDYQNQKRPTESVGSDLHLGSGRSSLYVRDLFGNIVPGGASYSEDVRDTIDAVASVLRPND